MYFPNPVCDGKSNHLYQGETETTNFKHVSVLFRYQKLEDILNSYAY